MAYSLVGTIGAASQGASSAALTPAWGTGENRTAGNLLVCFCTCGGSTGNPATPSGWSAITPAFGGTASSIIFYKVAAGGDAAPTLSAVSGGILSAQLAEFTGGSGTLDQTGAQFATSSPVTATQGAADTASGELLLICGVDHRSAARSTNDTLTSNVGTVTAAGNNNGTNIAEHYSFGYVLSTTSNASADTATMTASVTTSIVGFDVATASFKVGPQSLTRTATDAPTTTESVGKIEQLFRTVTDAPTTSESIATIRTKNRSASESLTASDSPVFPSYITGLKAWYKADALALSDGAAVTSWADSSGNGNTIVPASTNPTYRATGGPNSTAAVQFDGVANTLIIAPFATGTLAQPDTIVSVFNTGRPVEINAAGHGDPSNRQMIDWTAGTITVYAGSATQTATGWASGFGILSVIFNGASSQIIVNRGSPITVSPGTGGLMGLSMMLYDATNVYAGTLCELLMYSSALATTDRQAVENYLNAKYFQPGISRILIAYRAPIDAPVTSESAARIGSFNRTNTDAPHTAESVTATKSLFRSAVESLKIIDGTQPLPSISGLRMRIEADSLGLSDGVHVQTWTDLSGSGFNCSQGTVANQPIFRANVINGLPALQFDGAAQYMTFSVSSIITGAATVFVITQPGIAEAVQNAYATIIGNEVAATTGNGFWIAAKLGTSVWGTFTQVSNDLPSGNALAVGTAYLLETTQLSGSACFIYQNGVQVATRAENEYGLNGANPGLGNDPNHAGRFYNGYIASALIYNSVLSTANRQAVENYLQVKYGLISGSASRSLALVRSATDAPTTSESVLAVKTLFRSAAEALATSESASSTKPPVNRTAADAPVTSENAARTLQLSRTATDAPVTSEAASRTGSFIRTGTEAPATSEAAAGIKILFRSATEALSTSETAARGLQLFRTTSDAPTTSENALRTLQLVRSSTDAPITSEVTSRTGLFNRVTSDAPHTSEAITSVAAHPRSVTEAITTSENVSRIAVLVRTASDALSTAEVATGTKLSGVVRNAMESIATAEVASRIFSGNRAASEALATSEIASRSILTARSTSESLSIAQSVSRVAQLLRTASDALSTAEAATQNIVHGGQAVNRTASDALTTAEIASRIVVGTRAAADSPATAESVIRSIASMRSATEALATAENAARLANILRSTVDNPTALAVAARMLALLRSASDTPAVAEALARLTGKSRTTSETLTTAESVARSLAAARSAVELLAFSEIAARRLTLLRVSSDSLLIQQTVSAVRGLQAQIVEFSFVTDIDPLDSTLVSPKRGSGFSIIEGDSTLVSPKRGSGFSIIEGELVPKP